MKNRTSETPENNQTLAPVPSLESVLETVRAGYLAAQDRAASDGNAVALQAVEHALARYRDAIQNAPLRAYLASLGLPMDLPDSDTAALELHAAVERLPELRVSGTQLVSPVPAPLPAEGPAGVDLPDEEEDEEGPAAETELYNAEAPGRAAYPLLSRAIQATNSSRLMLLGGVLDPRRITWLAAQLFVEKNRIEWVLTGANGDGAAMRRIGNLTRDVVAVIGFIGTMGHDADRRARDTCRSLGIPYVTGRTPGVGVLRRTLGDLEEHFASKRVA